MTERPAFFFCLAPKRALLSLDEWLNGRIATERSSKASGRICKSEAEDLSRLLKGSIQLLTTKEVMLTAKQIKEDVEQ